MNSLGTFKNSRLDILYPVSLTLIQDSRNCLMHISVTVSKMAR